MGIIEAEIDVLQIEKRIRGRVKQQMEKSQREYYLNEQMKAIQKELGEMDDVPNEVEELQEKIDKAGMSKEAKTKADAELNKLKMMSPMSAEATVVRNYIDWLVSVPWKKRTKIRHDLARAETVLDIGTGENALLARMCVDAGARRVYAVEVLADAFDKASALIREQGLEGRLHPALGCYVDELVLTGGDAPDTVAGLGSVEGRGEVGGADAERLGGRIPDIGQAQPQAANPGLRRLREDGPLVRRQCDDHGALSVAGHALGACRRQAGQGGDDESQSAAGHGVTGPGSRPAW